VDLAIMSGIDGRPKPAHAQPALRLFDQAGVSNRGLGGNAGDGMVDERGADFVSDPSRFQLLEQGHDHLNTISNPAAIDDLLSRIPPVAPDTLQVLRQLAPGSDGASARL
jgi:hypothetical protein